MLKRTVIKTIFFLVALLVTTGCSGIYPYKNNHDKNLTVKTRADSGSFFASVKTRVDVYAVDRACKISYKGSVNLKQKETLVGLPPGSPVYLDFIFSRSNFLASHKGSTGFDTYFKTRIGYEYVAEASYLDGIYDVILKERKKGSKKERELGYGECKPK